MTNLLSMKKCKAKSYPKSIKYASKFLTSDGINLEVRFIFNKTTGKAIPTEVILDDINTGSKLRDVLDAIGMKGKNTEEFLHDIRKRINRFYKKKKEIILS